LPFSGKGGARGSVSAAGGGRVRVASRVAGADYICFNDDVRRSADQHQVLDVVAADENEPPARVDASVVDNGESGLTPARARAAQPTGTEPANRPGSGADQTEHDEKS
jgi:hypothetical protein